MSSSRPALHPSLDFPPVGLAAPVDFRWVEFFEGQVGEPVWSVWLGHLVADGLLIVRTAPRRRWDEVMGYGNGATSLRKAGSLEFHARGVQALVDAARPELPKGERELYNRRIPGVTSSLAKGWAEREKLHWQLDGRPVQAGLLRFAHAWTGVTLGDSDRYIGVTGFNVAPLAALEKDLLDV